MKIKPIREKDELVRIIKTLAKDLDERAESIASDFNSRIRSINISADIEVGCIPEWSITKNYPVLVITDEIADKIDDIINNPNDAPKSIKAQAEIIAPVKVNPVEEIAKAVNESIIKNPCDIEIRVDYGNGLNKSSMFGGDG